MQEIANEYWSMGFDAKRGAALLYGDWRDPMSASAWKVMPDCRGTMSPMPQAWPGTPRNDHEVRSIAPSHGLHEASFIMAPYSNRVLHGSFVFAGQSYQLPRGEEHAIHGCVREREWEVAEHGSTKISFLYEHLVPHQQEYLPSNPVWPWPFRAQYQVELLGDAVHQSLTLWNLHHSPVPLGGGLHPYFLRQLQRYPSSPNIAAPRGADRPLNSPRLQLPVTGTYPTEQVPCIPSGSAAADELSRELKAGKQLGPTDFIDHCLVLGDKEGKKAGRIIWSEAQLEMRLQFQDATTHVVVYNPNQAFFAVEPVSHANNGLNMTGQAGLQTVRPGDWICVAFTMQLQNLSK